MAGSVRNVGDESRAQALRQLAKDLGIEVRPSLPARAVPNARTQANVEFAINVPYPELITLFGRASIGLHTMIDEHFGITVVEFMVRLASCLPPQQATDSSTGGRTHPTCPYLRRPVIGHCRAVPRTPNWVPRYDSKEFRRAAGSHHGAFRGIRSRDQGTSEEECGGEVFDGEVRGGMDGGMERA